MMLRGTVNKTNFCNINNNMVLVIFFFLKNALNSSNSVLNSKYCMIFRRGIRQIQSSLSIWISLEYGQLYIIGPLLHGHF